MKQNRNCVRKIRLKYQNMWSTLIFISILLPASADTNSTTNGKTESTPHPLAMIRIRAIIILTKLSVIQHSSSSPYVEFNENGDSFYVELVLVVDNGMYEHLDKNLTEVHSRCTDIVNIVNGVSI